MMSEFIERVSHFFAENRPLSSLLLVAMVVFGLASFFLMPKQYNPEIVRPAFLISFAYEGATTAEAIDRVGYELVEKLQVVPGVDDILVTVRDGATITATVIFAVDHEATKAKVDILSQLEGHSYLATGNVSPVTIQEINPETIPVLQVALSSPTETVHETRARVLRLRDRIVTVLGVSELMVVGGETPSVIVEIDPLRLAASGVSLETVREALSSASLTVSQAGLADERYRVPVTFAGRVTSIAALGALPLMTQVYLRDVATIYEGVSTERSYTLYADKETAPMEVVMLAVAKREGASAPQVTAAVRATLDAAIMEPEFASLSYTVVSDDGAVASQEITGLTMNLLTSIAIVAVVLFLFLSLRAALVVLITVPLTFLMVLGIGFLFDETINRITLFALILSLGLLVDASIVVVDTIYTHLKEAAAHGRAVSRTRVAAGAVREVGVGLVLSMITSVIVFLPMNYITGMMGPYMEPISFFVPFALIASLIIAIVLTPFIATHLLSDKEHLPSFTRWFQRRLDHVTLRYQRLVRALVSCATLRRRVLGGALVAFLITLLFPIVGLVHFQMLPKADRDQLYVYLDAPVGTAREATRELAEQTAMVALTHPEVKSTQLFVAGAPIIDFNGMFKGAALRSQSEQATLRVNLTAAATRSESSTAIATELRALFQTALSENATYVRIMEEPPGPPVMATLVLKVSAPETVLNSTIDDLRSLLTQTAGVVDIYDSRTAPIEEVVYTLDREQASIAGVAPSELATWFSLLSAAIPVGEFTGGAAGERSPLLLSLPMTYRENPVAAEGLPLRRSDGGIVAFGGLVTTSYEPHPEVQFMEGATSLQYITAEVEGRSIVYATIDIIRALVSGGLVGYTVTEWNLFGLTLETATGDRLTLAWGGEWEMTLENFRDLGMAMLAALFLIYAVLVAQYRSFAIPGFILVTVPLGLVGILTGFVLLDVGFSIYLTATALIGFIALIGIVVNNAIIYLEYVDQALAEGTAYADALVAAGMARLRPILLTSLTTVLGSLTIASDPVWSGLAWSIVFGLSFSTVLTLVVFPTLLMHFARRELRVE